MNVPVHRNDGGGAAEPVAVGVREALPVAFTVCETVAITFTVAGTIAFAGRGEGDDRKC